MAMLARIGGGLVMFGILSSAGSGASLAQENRGAPAARSQDRPSFEVASVRPAATDLLRPDPQPPRARAGGRFDAIARLRRLINWAFKPEVPFEGSFRELDDVFAITAKAPDDALLAGPNDVGPMNQMLQSLLAERFKLRVRWESRSFQVFALRRTTTERLGPGLKRIAATCPPGYPENVLTAPDGCGSILRTDRGSVSGFVAKMEDFARLLTMFAGQRVVDDTGLAGPFEVRTTFNPRSDTDFGSPAQEQLPSLRDALRNDLGLKLEQDRRDLRVLIIEHVEQPTPD